MITHYIQVFALIIKPLNHTKGEGEGGEEESDREKDKNIITNN